MLFLQLVLTDSGKQDYTVPTLSRGDQSRGQVRIKMRSRAHYSSLLAITVCLLNTTIALMTAISTLINDDITGIGDITSSHLGKSTDS